MDVDQTIESEETPEKKTKFDWDETISSLLKQKGNEMKLNKLKKKCVVGVSQIQDDISKKVSPMPSFLMHNVCHAEKHTNRSSILLLHLVRFSV